MFFLWLKIIFWTGLLLLVYTYVGYGVLLGLLTRFRRPPSLPEQPDEMLPELAFVCCAYNEADCIEQKIANSLALDYPIGRIRFYFVTDGSTDATPELVGRYVCPPGVQITLLHRPERRGKIAAFQRAMEHITAPLVVSTDANTLLNPEALRRMVRHFQDAPTGAVAGEKKVQASAGSTAGAATEGVYWRYESWLKQHDALLWSVVGAAGELFAFRREAYEQVPADTIIEDFYLTLRMAQKGWRVAYEPGAWALENASVSAGEELKRKIRIAAGGLQAIARLKPLLNPLRYGVLSFQYVSHRVLRWTLAPLALPLVYAANLALAWRFGGLYGWLCAAQTLFYLAALAGYGLERRNLRIKALFIPWYFCLMNYAVYAGCLRLLRGRQTVLWEKAERG